MIKMALGVKSKNNCNNNVTAQTAQRLKHLILEICEKKGLKMISKINKKVNFIIIKLKNRVGSYHR